MAKGEVNIAKSFVFFILGLFSTAAFSQQIIELQRGKNASIRGLSVVSNSVAWVSGSNGYTGLTTDGGNTWKWNQLSGYEKFDFRDIEAFSATEAIIVNAGSPAVILLTLDGGGSWKEVYRNNSPDIFLDGMDFWDRKRGIIYGDPISGKMQLLETRDSGRSWKDISQQLSVPLIEGEASFAASGTAIRTLRRGKVFIASGGTQSRLFYSGDYGKTWKVSKIPVVHGQPSTGPFSIAFRNKRTGVATGGDYLRDTSRMDNMVLTNSGGIDWTAPQENPFGYRSAIEYYSGKVVLATGTSGTDISKDGGLTWEKLSDQGYNCVRRAKKGKLVLLAGSNGRISKLLF